MFFFSLDSMAKDMKSGSCVVKGHGPYLGTIDDCLKLAKDQAETDCNLKKGNIVDYKWWKATFNKKTNLTPDREGICQSHLVVEQGCTIDFCKEQNRKTGP